MGIIDSRIDGGKEFDWGRTSVDYAKFRDIYPEEFYNSIAEHGLCVKGQNVLDLGTGTGVLPRNMQKFGAKWTGTDISENQIEQARILSEGMDINYVVSSAEDLHFPDGTFDVITACQCFWYFDHERILPNLCKMLKPGGRILVMYMAWLPFEDKIAGESERLVLKYSPQWSGAGETVHPIEIPKCYFTRFELVCHEENLCDIPFTRESWNGRIKACRGVGASLSEAEIVQFEREHLEMLNKIAPEEFSVKHYSAYTELKLK